jgi:hypothetical protein
LCCIKGLKCHSSAVWCVLYNLWEKCCQRTGILEVIQQVYSMMPPAASIFLFVFQLIRDSIVKDDTYDVYWLDGLLLCVVYSTYIYIIIIEFFFSFNGNEVFRGNVQLCFLLFVEFRVFPRKSTMIFLFLI